MRAPVDAVAPLLLDALDLSSFRLTGGQTHGYERAAHIVRGDRVFARLLFGGNGGGTNVQGSGLNAPHVAQVLQASGFGLSASRIDVCEDYTGAGVFDRLSGKLLRYAARRGLCINQQGDWHRGLGRTLYLGTRAGGSQVVLYEKGYELAAKGIPGACTDLVRLETRIYPQKAHKEPVARMSPQQVQRCTRLAAEVLELVTGLELPRVDLGSLYTASDSDRARAALVRQYGRVLVQLVEELGSPDAAVQWVKAQMALRAGGAHFGVRCATVGGYSDDGSRECGPD